MRKMHIILIGPLKDVFYKYAMHVQLTKKIHELSQFWTDFWGNQQLPLEWLNITNVVQLFE